MDRLDPARRVARRRAPVTFRIVVLPVVLSVVLLAVALSMTALPPTSAEAATYLAYYCDPEPEPPEPNIARPRVALAGKDLNGDSLVPGDEILWTVTVKNLGDTLTGITITDVVPEWTSYVEGSIEGTGGDGSGLPTLNWAVGTLKCGERVTVSFRSRVDDGAPGGTLITNQASADSAETPAGVSKAVTLEVAGASGSLAGKSASTPTTVAALESSGEEDSSAQASGEAVDVAQAAPASSETTAVSSSPAGSENEASGEDSDSTTAVAGDDSSGWKLGVGLGVGLGGLALIGGAAGLMMWRRKNSPAA